MRPRLILTVCAASALAIAAYAVIAPSALPRLLRLKDEEHDLAADVQIQKNQNARLSDEVRVLQGNEPESAAVLEKKAREELGWVKHDEIVLSVPVTAPAIQTGSP